VLCDDGITLFNGGYTRKYYGEAKKDFGLALSVPVLPAPPVRPRSIVPCGVLKGGAWCS
jgi:hypothetical protein